MRFDVSQQHRGFVAVPRASMSKGRVQEEGQFLSKSQNSAVLSSLSAFAAEITAVAQSCA